MDERNEATAAGDGQQQAAQPEPAQGECRVCASRRYWVRLRTPDGNGTNLWCLQCGLGGEVVTMSYDQRLPDDNEALAVRVPQHLLAALRRYAINHEPTGSFLHAVLANDLMRAVAHADEYSTAALSAIVAYVFNCLPMACWGSPENVREWLSIRVVT